MVAIKDIKMPKNCVECDNMGLRYSLGCELIFNGCANCGRHPDCPLVEIVTCKDCTNHVTGALDEEICLKGHELIHENFYCKDGERRVDNGRVYK